MVRLEDIVTSLFAEKPSLTRDEAVEELRNKKDPKTNKCPWHVITIRNRVDGYLSKRKQAEQIIVDESKGIAPEFETKPKANIEGKEIQRRRQDIFASGEKDIAVLNLNDVVAKQISEQITPEIISFKKEILGIATSLKDTLKLLTENIENEIILLKVDFEKKFVQVKERVGLKEEIEYDEIELKKSTIDAIKEIIVTQKIEEPSDYIDSLLANEKLWTSGLEFIEAYKKIVNAVKEAGKRLILDCSIGEDEKLAIDIYVFPRAYKKLLIGIGIGATITAVVIYLLTGVLHLIPI
ncbi:MAG: hypothetical protein IMZ53_08360 [Thermoplasmata archaeon]|nr:hypothetical protein [Thermoplasmata archaeon]MBE3140581.1 hypothetical protein [Thermoplasmata archaeon]